MIWVKSKGLFHGKPYPRKNHAQSQHAGEIQRTNSHAQQPKMIEDRADENLPGQQNDQGSCHANTRNHVAHRKNDHETKRPGDQRIPGNGPPVTYFSGSKDQHGNQHRNRAAQMDDEDTLQHTQPLTDHAGHRSL